MSLGIVASAHVEPAGGGGGAEPDDLTGLSLWLDADDASTFTYSSGVVVSGWNDKSPSGYHFSQADASRQPSRSGTLNGVTAVTFDGSLDILRRANAPINNSTDGSFTLFAVAASTSLSGTRRIVDGDAVGSGGARVAQYLRTNSTQIESITFTTGASPSFVNGGSLSTSTPYLFCVASTGTATELFLDGTSIDTATQTNQMYSATVPVSIGAQESIGDHWSGPIGEIVCYSRALTSGERGDITSYLITKWGI